MRRRTFLQAALAAAVPLPYRSEPRREPVLVERWSWAMGQPVHLRLFHRSESAGLEVAQAVFAELRRVEARLSLFDDASDLTELNRRAGRGGMRADQDLVRVLESACRFRQATAGAFDVAVEPLMRAWGFHRARPQAPTPPELEEARESVAAAEILIDGDRVMLPVRHTAIDLGGIAVGYGLDRAALVLKAAGVSQALLDVSGDILALGAPPGRLGWPVDIAGPEGGAPVASVLLRDRALATSNNRVSVVNWGGIRRGHVMDPASGYPASRVLQATAVARTGIAADALSTAMLVAGARLPGAEQGWILPLS